MFKKAVLAEILTLSIILVAVFILGVSISFFGLTLKNIFKPKSANSSQASFAKATPAPLNNNTQKKGVYNVLFMGYGGGNHDGALLTDSIIVIHVDTNSHKADLISVPRDLWVPGNQKINAAGISGFQNSSPVVQNVTGLPINYYVAIDFSDFTKLIDNLGGVTITMPNNLNDSFFPILGQEANTCGFTPDQINAFKAKYSGFQLESQFACRYEHLQYAKGQVVTLDGATALKVTRSRHGDSDFARSVRQFAVLQGIGNKLISLKSLGKVDDTISTLFQMVNTDLNLGTIKSLIQVFGDPGLYKLNQIQLSTDNVLNEGFASDGEYILSPKSGGFDYSSIKNYINQNL